MNTTLNAIEIGAIGDKKTDNTAVLQKAIDDIHSAGGGTIYFPVGQYRTNLLVLHDNVVLKADESWAYGQEQDKNATLLPICDEQIGILDLSHARGSSILGLCMYGENRGTNMSGITMTKNTFGPREDCLRIEKCKIYGFSSHAVNLHCAWCFSIRHNMFSASKGDGLHLKGWDGFVLDNWFSGNDGAGFGTEDLTASVTMTGNRIEWNKAGGIVIKGGKQYNITGNYIDRCGAGGIVMIPNKDENGVFLPSHTNTITGNIIYRTGRLLEENCPRSAHIVLDRVIGTTVMGNTLSYGQNDDRSGDHSPESGMVLRGLNSCVVRGNTLFACATKNVIKDLGEHTPDTVIAENPGSIVDMTGVTPDMYPDYFINKGYEGTAWENYANNESNEFDI